MRKLSLGRKGVLPAASRLLKGGGWRRATSLARVPHTLSLCFPPSICGDFSLNLSWPDPRFSSNFRVALSFCCHGSRTFDLSTHSPVGLLSFFRRTSLNYQLIPLRPSSVRLSIMVEQCAQGLRGPKFSSRGCLLQNPQ